MQSQIYVRIGLEEESQGKRENKAGKKAKQAQREQNRKCVVNNTGGKSGQKTGRQEIKAGAKALGGPLGPFIALQSTLIARYEERGSYPKPRSWDNCDELETPYRGKNWYGDPNSSQLAQLLGFRYDPRSSYLAIKLRTTTSDQHKNLCRLSQILHRPPCRPPPWSP